MKKTIELDGKAVEFEATGTIDICMRKLFDIDLMSTLTKINKDDAGATTALCSQMAFVMNKRAELGGWRKVCELTQDDYYDWLDRFGSDALLNASKEIMEIYIQNKKTTSTP